MLANYKAVQKEVETFSSANKNLMPKTAYFIKQWENKPKFPKKSKENKRNPRVIDDTKDESQADVEMNDTYVNEDDDQNMLKLKNVDRDECDTLETFCHTEKKTSAVEMNESNKIFDDNKIEAKPQVKDKFEITLMGKVGIENSDISDEEESESDSSSEDKNVHSKNNIEDCKTEFRDNKLKLSSPLINNHSQLKHPGCSNNEESFSNKTNIVGSKGKVKDLKNEERDVQDENKIDFQNEFTYSFKLFTSPITNSSKIKQSGSSNNKEITSSDACIVKSDEKVKNSKNGESNIQNEKKIEDYSRKVGKFKFCPSPMHNLSDIKHSDISDDEEFSSTETHIVESKDVNVQNEKKIEDHSSKIGNLKFSPPQIHNHSEIKHSDNSDDEELSSSESHVDEGKEKTKDSKNKKGNVNNALLKKNFQPQNKLKAIAMLNLNELEGLDEIPVSSDDKSEEEEENDETDVALQNNNSDPFFLGPGGKESIENNLDDFSPRNRGSTSNDNFKKFPREETKYFQRQENKYNQRMDFQKFPRNSGSFSKNFKSEMHSHQAFQKGKFMSKNNSKFPGGERSSYGKDNFRSQKDFKGKWNTSRDSHGWKKHDNFK